MMCMCDALDLSVVLMDLLAAHELGIFPGTTPSLI
jgi:hypothetical protein